MMGDKDWRFPKTSGHHHPVTKLEEERHEEIMMGDKSSRFPGTTGTVSGSQATRMEKRGDYDGRQGLAISQDSRQSIRFPSNKTEDIRKLCRSPEIPGTPSRFPSFEKGDTRRS